MNESWQDVRQVTDQIIRRFGAEPAEAILVAGSALGGIVEALDDREDPAPYGEIGLRSPRVAGHQGALVVGRIAGRRVACLCGRSHFYEGIPAADVMRPLRALRFWNPDLGQRPTVYLTSAVGGISASMPPRSVVVVRDHLNRSGISVLQGAPFLPGRTDNFLDLCPLYDADLRRAAVAAGAELGITIQEGVYACTSGPTYETPAEVRALEAEGADVVGMSLSHEAVAALHVNLRVAGFCVVSNFAAGKSSAPITHEEVKENVQGMARPLGRIIRRIIEMGV